MNSSLRTRAVTCITPKLALFAPLRSAGSSTLPAFIADLRQLRQKETFVSGVEVSIEDLGADGTERRESAQLIQESGFDLLVNVDINRDGKIGMENIGAGSSSSISSKMVQSFASHLVKVSDLGDIVSHINFRSFGTRRVRRAEATNNLTQMWDDDVALEYLLDVLPLSAQFLEDHPYIGNRGNEIDVMGGSPDHLTGISHETTAFRHNIDSVESNDIGILHNPTIVRHLLETIPPLRLTMDLSSWHDVHGYPWGYSTDVDEAEALSVEIVPHIDLIRTRTSLLSDCYTNKKVNSTRSDQFLRTHQSMWKEVWTRKTNRGVKEVYMTVEDDGYESTAEFEENSYTSRMERLRDSIRAIRQCYDSWLRAHESEASSDSKLKR